MLNSPMIQTALNLFLTVALLTQPALSGMGQTAFAGRACSDRGDGSSETVQCGGCGCCEASSNGGRCRCCAPPTFQSTAAAVSNAPAESNASLGDPRGVSVVRMVASGCDAGTGLVERRKPTTKLSAEDGESHAFLESPPSLLEVGSLDQQPLVSGACFCELRPQPTHGPAPWRGDAEVRGAHSPMGLSLLVHNWNSHRFVPLAACCRQPVLSPHFSQIHLCIWRL